MLNILAFMYSVHFCYQIIINKWNTLIIICKTNTQCMSCSAFHPLEYKSVQRSLWDVGLVTFLYFQQYLSHRRASCHFLKLPLGVLIILELWCIPVPERLKSYTNLRIRLHFGVPTDLQVFLVVTNVCTFNHTCVTFTSKIKYREMDLLCPKL
jgi:hypothetical protein